MKGQSVWGKFPRIAKVCKSWDLDKWEGRRRIFQGECTRYLPLYNELPQHGKFQSIYYLTVSMGPESRCVLAGSSRVSHQAAVISSICWMRIDFQVHSCGCWQNLSPHVDFSTILAATFHCICHIPLRRNESVSTAHTRRKEIIWEHEWIPGGRAHWGPHQRLPTTRD